MEWADGEPLARRWRWLFPEQAGWLSVHANPNAGNLRMPAMNQAEALAAAKMDTSAPAVVLVRPRVAGNVGLVAQAMLSFGLSNLLLVDPFCDHLSAEALSKARGAQEVLKGARIFDSVPDAAKRNKLKLIVAATTNPTNRDLRNVVFADSEQGGEAVWEADGGVGGQGVPSYNPRSCANVMKQAAVRNEKTAFMIGPESTGLSSSDLVHADGLVHIPAHPAFASLGIANALTILAYESWIARSEGENQ